MQRCAIFLFRGQNVFLDIGPWALETILGTSFVVNQNDKLSPESNKNMMAIPAI
jgi:hypothetical protein